MGDRNLPLLQVHQQTGVLCEEYRASAMKACEESNQKNSSCQEIANRQREKCQRAMKHASKLLNIGGCLRAEQQVILCEMEWCDQSGGMVSSLEQCRTECTGVRQLLRECIDAQIQASLRAFGFVEREPLPSSIST